MSLFNKPEEDYRTLICNCGNTEYEVQFTLVPLETWVECTECGEAVPIQDRRRKHEH